MAKNSPFAVSDYIEKLNKAQKEAVVNYEGPSLIVAGAGSGKTRVLTCRIAYMLENKISPYHILALTFTKKAAKEMTERIGTLVSPELARNLWMGTFHSVFSKILRREADKLGYQSSFTIYDTSDSKNVIKSVIKELNLNDETYKTGDMLSRISQAKNNLVTPQAYEANSSLLAEDRERRRPQFAEVYKRYWNKCRENGAMDFDDLLININILFRDFPETLVRYQNQFRYILVDEYQDTNIAQYIIIRRLAEAHANICVVGDDAQSIYSFRGARIENILRFQNDFPKANIFKLEQNYRSTRTIVDAANSIIEKNTRQIRKKAFSEAAVGDKIKVLKAYTDKEEAILIANDLYASVREDGAQYSDAAVLYRTNAQSRALEEAFRGRNIPYKIYGGVSFYQRKEIKDLLAYIRLVVNPRDDEAFRRIINVPARGIGDVTIGRIAEAAAKHSVSMWEAAHSLTPEEMELKGAATKKVTEFTRLIGEFSAMRQNTEAYTLGLEIAMRSGILGSYKMQQTPEAVSALENIEEMINSIRSYVEDEQNSARERNEEGQGVIPIDEWLQNVMLLTDMDTEKPEERNKVTLMTVHAAKGLEFEYVYVAGLEENLFPSMMSLGTPEGLEEERRLFYVALTRAKKSAVLSFAESRFKWGEMSFSRPSRFLGEIDQQYLELSFDPAELTASARPEEDGEAGTGYRERRSPHGTAGYSGSPYRRGYGAEGNRNASGRGAGQNPREGTRTYYPGRDSAAADSRRTALQGRMRSLHGNTEPSRSRAFGYGSVSESRSAAGNASPTETSRPAASSGDYTVGARVSHAKFGPGTVTAIEEFAGDLKLTVRFEAAGTKTLLMKFAKLTLIP